MRFWALILTFISLALQPAMASDCTVTKAQYDALQHGMSYSQAVGILGCEGEELSSSDIAGTKTIMLMWKGDSFGANMTAMFQDDRMIQKAQFGLR